MKVLFLKSVERKSFGKGSSRFLRRSGNIPAILYGPGLKSVKLSVGLAGLNGLLRSSRSSQFLFDLDVEGEIKKVTIKDIQRHPVSAEILHVDFYQVAMDREIRVSVLVETVGSSKGVELGGMLQIIRRKVDVLCLPTKIPDSLIVDVSDLDIGDSIHAADLPLEDGVKITGDPDSTILTVLSQKIEDDDLEDEDLGIEDGEAVEENENDIE